MNVEENAAKRQDIPLASVCMEHVPAKNFPVSEALTTQHPVPRTQPTCVGLPSRSHSSVPCLGLETQRLNEGQPATTTSG